MLHLLVHILRRPGANHAVCEHHLRAGSGFTEDKRVSYEIEENADYRRALFTQESVPQKEESYADWKVYHDIGRAWLFTCIFMVYYFAILLSIIWVCECVKDEAQKIGSNIHQILVTTFDEQLAAEVR